MVVVTVLLAMVLVATADSTRQQQMTPARTATRTRTDEGFSDAILEVRYQGVLAGPGRGGVLVFSPGFFLEAYRKLSLKK
jgi:hypothetical protein